MFFHCDSSPLREGWLESRQVECIRPVAFVRSSKDFENLKDLVDFTISSEQRTTLCHFSKDTTSRPQINSKRVCLLAKKDFRASVPKCDNFVSVGLDGQSKGTGKSEISQFNLSTGRVDEQILRLQVPVEDAMLMAVNQSMQNLEQEALCLFLRQRYVSSRAHVLL